MLLYISSLAEFCVCGDNMIHFPQTHSFIILNPIVSAGKVVLRNVRFNGCLNRKVKINHLLGKA